MKNIKKIFIFFTLIILHISASFAQEPDMDELYIDTESDMELDAEFQWLQAETVVTTEIATKTKMDAELVPGMVTVLKGKDLKNRGVRTVYESLKLVPGLNTSINSSGEKLVSVRGIGGSLLSGNLKLMLNNIVLNDTMSATGSVLYGISVEQVDRIEIIRGPGSVIYGEYAYAGVINVITHQKGNQLYGYYDDNGGYGGGGTLTYEEPEKELSLNLNISGWKSDGSDVKTGKDRLYSDIVMGENRINLSQSSQSPGSTNEAEEDRMANLAFNYKDFSIQWQYLLTGNGDYFGMLHALPPDDDRIVISHENRTLGARQRLNFSNSLDADVSIGWRRYVYNMDNLIALPPIPELGLPDGSIVAPHYEERELFAGTELIWKGTARHTLLTGIKYTDITTENIWVDANTTDENRGTMVRIQGEGNWITEDRTRKIFSLYMQDMFMMTDDFSITGGLRYDHYEDNDNSNDSITPRISAVWQITTSHILKAQYSEAIRPPSFSELYAAGNSIFKGNKDLEPEHIRSYELGYVYRHRKTTGRMTFFYSELEDNIAYPQYADSFGGQGIQYGNAADEIRTIGFETEFEQTLRSDLRLSANLSFADTEDVGTGEPLENAIEWMGNASLTYEPLKDYMLALQYRYVGSPYRASDDDREKVDAYHTFNLTANCFNLFKKGLTLRLGIKNLLDDDIVYPAPVFKEGENIGYYYKDDFLREGREWWAQISYEF